jgi:hypothetical protein
MNIDRTFNDDRMSLTAFEDGYDQSPYLLLRALDPETGSAWFSRRGAHELCVEREGSCLILKRWSRKDVCFKTWAILNFVTWEGEYSKTKLHSHTPPFRIFFSNCVA